MEELGRITWNPLREVLWRLARGWGQNGGRTGADLVKKTSGRH